MIHFILVTSVIDARICVRPRRQSSEPLSSETHTTQAPTSQTSTASTSFSSSLVTVSATISSTASAVTTRNSTTQILTTTTPQPPSSEVCTTNPSYLCPNQIKTPNFTCCPDEYLQEYECYETLKFKGKILKSTLVHYFCCASEADY
jgi:hypothetical protein